MKVTRAEIVGKCASLTKAGKCTAFCMPESANRQFDDPFMVLVTRKSVGDDDRLEKEKEKEVEIGDGLAGDGCQADGDCRDGRKCRHVNEDERACDGREGCQCRWQEGLGGCVNKESNECGDDEVCADIKDAYPQQRKCISRVAFQADMDSYNILKVY